MGNGRISEKNIFTVLKKNLAFAIFFVFFLNFYFLPFAKAVTIQEQFTGNTLSDVAKKDAGKKNNRPKKEYRVKLNHYGKVENRQQKDPRLACLLSLMLPGAGHIYLRKDLKGAGFCLAAGAGYSFAGYFLYDAMLGKSGNRSDYIMSGLFFFIASIIHVVGVVEAYNDASEYNSGVISGSRNPYTGN